MFHDQQNIYSHMFYPSLDYSRIDRHTPKPALSYYIYTTYYVFSIVIYLPDKKTILAYYSARWATTTWNLANLARLTAAADAFSGKLK